MTAAKTPANKRFSLDGRPPMEVGVIIAAIAAAAIIIMVFLEWLASEKGLLAQRRQRAEVADDAGE